MQHWTNNDSSQFFPCPKQIPQEQEELESYYYLYQATVRAGLHFYILKKQ